MTITLKSGATMDQFTTFYNSKLIPAYEKQFQGVTGYLVSGVRGDNKNSVGVIWLFKTEADRNKYFGAARSISKSQNQKYRKYA